MRKLAIIHFSPIELYPPVLNWINFLAGRQEPGLQVRVFTMHPGGTVRPFMTGSDDIKIFRFGKSGKKGVYAYLNYLVYYCATSLQLIKWLPDTILYYETLSSFPALFFKECIRRKSSLFIHYHEYTSKNEYRQGMRLSRWLHRREEKLYYRAEWISHTNSDRINLFKKDLETENLLPIYSLPNYPPANWLAAGKVKSTINLPVKFVYVGALSLDTMYTREFAEWVLKQTGKVVWDIYSDNITQEAREYLESFKNNLISFRGGINYYSLPDRLSGYDIGLILYKGHIENYVYNAPNKLFEYLACGLDIWFPDVMKGCLPFVTSGVYPKVSAFDFKDLSKLDLLSVVGRRALQYAPNVFYAEEVFLALLNKMNINK